jgi:hypothetical protein
MTARTVLECDENLKRWSAEDAHLRLLRRHANVALIDAQVLRALGARVVEGVAGIKGWFLAWGALVGRRIVYPIELDLIPLLRCKDPPLG